MNNCHCFFVSIACKVFRMRSEILLIVDRLKAGDCFELFVFALQLVYPISIRQCKETVYCWVKVVSSSTCWDCSEEGSSGEELGPLGEGGQGWGCEDILSRSISNLHFGSGRS